MPYKHDAINLLFLAQRRISTRVWHIIVLEIFGFVLRLVETFGS